MQSTLNLMLWDGFNISWPAEICYGFLNLIWMLWLPKYRVGANDLTCDPNWKRTFWYLAYPMSCKVWWSKKNAVCKLASNYLYNKMLVNLETSYACLLHNNTKIRFQTDSGLNWWWNHKNKFSVIPKNEVSWYLHNIFSLDHSIHISLPTSVHVRCGNEYTCNIMHTW